MWRGLLEPPDRGARYASTTIFQRFITHRVDSREYVETAASRDQSMEAMPLGNGGGDIWG